MKQGRELDVGTDGGSDGVNPKVLYNDKSLRRIFHQNSKLSNQNPLRNVHFQRLLRNVMVATKS